MELSSSTVTGLEAAASSTISDDAYSQLVAAVFQCALGLADQSVVEGIIMHFMHRIYIYIYIEPMLHVYSALYSMAYANVINRVCS